MRRVNTSSDVTATGLVQVDAGTGVQFTIPVASEGAEYRSGLLDLSGELMNGWTGTLFVEREGASVYFRGNLNGAEATSDIVWMLPSGFRAGVIQSVGGPLDYGAGITWTSENSPTMYRINHYLNRFQIVASSGTTNAININHHLRTRDDPPSTLPGAPV